MIAIVDSGHGNLFSIAQALRYIGADCIVTDLADSILNADRVIFPGVGAFETVMAALRHRNLVEPLRQVARKGTPFLGICLGMQLLGDESEEFGVHEGLGLIPGKIEWLPDGGKQPESDKIPNVGWRELKFTGNDSLLTGIPESSMVYFVHSLHFAITNEQDASATISVNNTNIVAAIRRNNVMGFQFHPENSGPVGLELLRRFVSLQPE